MRFQSRYISQLSNRFRSRICRLPVSSTSSSLRIVSSLVGGWRHCFPFILDCCDCLPVRKLNTVSFLPSCFLGQSFSFKAAVSEVSCLARGAATVTKSAHPSDTRCPKRLKRDRSNESNQIQYGTTADLARRHSQLTIGLQCDPDQASGKPPGDAVRPDRKARPCD